MSHTNTSKVSHDGKMRKKFTHAKEQLKSWTRDLRGSAMKLPSSLRKEGRQKRKALKEERERRKNAVHNLDLALTCLRKIREDQLGLFMQPGETLPEKVQSCLSEEKREGAKPEPEQVLEVFKSFQDDVDTMIGRVEKVKKGTETMRTTVHTKADLGEVEERAEIEYTDAVKLLSDIQASKEFQDSMRKIYSSIGKERMPTVGKGPQD